MASLCDVGSLKTCVIRWISRKRWDLGGDNFHAASQPHRGGWQVRTSPPARLGFLNPSAAWKYHPSPPPYSSSPILPGKGLKKGQRVLYDSTCQGVALCGERMSLEVCRLLLLYPLPAKSQSLWNPKVCSNSLMSWALTRITCYLS